MITIIRHKFSLMILYAVALHYLWAACAAVDRTAVQATALSVFQTLLHWPAWIMPAAFTLVASMAVIALCLPKIGKTAIALMLPQQFTLMISAWGAIEATINGHFGDGIARSHAFILADQCPAILAVIGHTLAIIGMGRK
jgi:hypothetical protein